MGQVLFALIALIFAFKILKNPGVEKLPWFFAGILFFPHSIVLLEKPLIPFPRFIIITLLLTSIFEHKNWGQLFKGFPLKSSLLILLFSSLCIGVFDTRIETYLRIYRPLTYYIENFLILFLTFLYIKNLKDVLKIHKVLICFFLAFALYGISNYITKQSEYYNIITEIYGGRNFAIDNMVGVDRFRIASFAWHAIYYGFLIVEILLIEFFLLSSVPFSKQNKIFYSIVFFLLCVNLFLVNSRTPLYALVPSLSIFIIFAIKMKQKLRIILAGFVIGIISLSFIPNASHIIDESLNTFSSNGSELEGSSVEMRTIQLGASVAIFNQSPIWGNGFSYIIEGLGYSSNANQRKNDSDLQGFESYLFKLLIEQGICGIVGNLIFFISLFFWLIRKYKDLISFGQRLVVLSVSMTIAFLLFIIGTGDMGAFPFFMSLIGIHLKAILLCDKRIISHSVYQSLKLSN